MPLSPVVQQITSKRSIDDDEGAAEIDVEHSQKRFKQVSGLDDDAGGGDRGDFDRGMEFGAAIRDAHVPVLDNLEGEANGATGIHEAQHNDIDDTITARGPSVDGHRQGDDRTVSKYGPRIANTSQFEQLADEPAQLYNAFPRHITSRHAAMHQAIGDEFWRWNANDYRQITPAMRQHTAKRFYDKLISITTPDKHSEKWLVYCSWSLEEKAYEICTTGSMLPRHSDKTLTATGKAKAEHLTGRSLGYIDRVEAIIMALDEVQVSKDVLDGVKDLEHAVVGAPLLAVRTKQAYKRNNVSRRTTRNIDGGATPSKRDAPKKNVVKREIKIEESATPRPRRFVMLRRQMTLVTPEPRGSLGRKIVQTMSPAIGSPLTPTPVGNRLPSFKGHTTMRGVITDERFLHGSAFAESEAGDAYAKFMRELEEAIRLEDDKGLQQHPHPGPATHDTSIDQDLRPLSPKLNPDDALDDWFDFAAAGADEPE